MKLADGGGGAVRRAFEATSVPTARRNEYKPGIAKNQAFGVTTVFGLLVTQAKKEGRAVNLNEILTNTELAGIQIVRSAKVRAAEALTLRSLLNKAKPPDAATTAPARGTR